MHVNKRMINVSFFKKSRSFVMIKIDIIRDYHKDYHKNALY
jgi:hypothetical protein